MANFKKAAFALTTAGLLCSGTAQAELFDRGGGLIYDDVLKITWLADANYAKTSGYDVDGQMSFDTANSWAAGLIYKRFDAAGNLYDSFDDWRLPTAGPLAIGQYPEYPVACTGYGCVETEMGYMHINNMGATSEYGKNNSILAGTNKTNLALFKNLQSGAYWTSTAFPANPTVKAYHFHFDSGQQVLGQDEQLILAWAVRDGDVAPIPEPETYAMMLAGLGLIGFMARRRKQSTL